MRTFLFLIALCSFLECHELRVHSEDRTHLFKTMESEENLKTFLFTVSPELQNLSDPLEVARELIPIFCHLCLDCHSTKDPNYTKKDHNALSAQEYYFQCLRNYEGMLCGGRNTFFGKVLNELFDIEAFSINMGIPNTRFTHVAVIVPIIHNDQILYYFFDAYYGCYYTDLEGQFLDLNAIFQGAPFRLQILNYEQFYGKGFEDERIFNLEREVHGTLHGKVKSFPFEQCSWRETLPLMYLDMGEVINLPVQSSKLMEDFSRLLRKHKIQGSML